jgi:hypothetical protein
MITYLFNRIELDTLEIKEISCIFEKFNLLFKDIKNSAIGKYSVKQIIESVEEALDYVESKTYYLKKWTNDYLDKNRGKLWLYYGLKTGSEYADYWQIQNTKTDELAKIWPFLYNRENPIYKNYEIDLIKAQKEIICQRARQSLSNPNYKPFHPDGCSRGCSCWMLDDMEQWYEEEQREINASNNIFFNCKLQPEFYKEALQELNKLKAQWINWVPDKKSPEKYNTTIKDYIGLTPIKILINWIETDFYYCSIFGMFHWSDSFMELWNNVDSINNFIKCQREKLKNINEILSKNGT